MDKLDPVFKALADPTRRQILDHLRGQPLTTGDICDLIPELSRCGVMKHLEILVDARLVFVRREGRMRWNYLNPVPIQQIHDRWISPYVAMHARNLLRLKQAVEDKPD